MIPPSRCHGEGFRTAAKEDIQQALSPQASPEYSPKAGIRYADDTTFMAESEEELKSLLIKVKEEGGKVGLKLNIQNFSLCHLINPNIK